MRRLSFVLFVLSFIGVLNAGAATYTWNGNTNVNWSVNANWTPSTGHPVAGDIANIPATAVAKMPTVDVPSACTTVNVTGSTTITLSSTLKAQQTMKKNSCLSDMNNDKTGKPKNPERIKKANFDPVKEALGHPNGPNLQEMLNGEEEKVLKKKKSENGEPEGGPIPVI